MEFIMKKPVDQASMKYCEKELENYKSSCVELDERSKNLEERCAALEVIIGSKNSKFDVRNIKLKAVEVEKIGCEDELKGLKRKNNELEERIAQTQKKVADLTFENEKSVQLMIENQVLEYEKKIAQDEVKILKEKVQELESKMELGSGDVGSLERINSKKIREATKPHDGVSLDNVQTKEKLVSLDALDETFCVSPSEGIGLSQVPGTPSIDTPFKEEKRGIHLEGGLGYDSLAKKQLAFENEQIHNTLITPSTSIGVRPASASVINNDGEDNEPDITRKSTLSDQKNEDLNDREGNHPFSRTPIRKRASQQIVTTDSESDDDDNVPISELMGMHPSSRTPKKKGATQQIVTTDSESDDDDNIPLSELLGKHNLQEPIHDLADSHLNSGSSTGANNVRTLSDQKNEDNWEGNHPFSRTPIRKRASQQILTTDSESDDDDDNVPISELMRMHPSSRTPKKKGASQQIVTTDSESDDDDNIPLSELLGKHNLQEPIHDLADSHLNSSSTGANNFIRTVTPLRRRGRLVRPRQHEEGSCAEQNSSSELGIPTTEEVEDDQTEETTEEVKDDQTEEVESDNEGESSGGFIVHSSSDSEMSGGSGKSDFDGDYSESESVSNSDRGYGVKRNRVDINWEFEGDMLAAFAKNYDLCLEAVCALYRQQTSHEKLVKGAILWNKRGFSQWDAPRGTTLAEILLDGNPEGSLKKSAEELGAYDLKLSRTLATRYSKQLFDIYKNKEDPYFCPSLFGLPWRSYAKLF